MEVLCRAHFESKIPENARSRSHAAFLNLLNPDSRMSGQPRGLSKHVCVYTR